VREIVYALFHASFDRYSSLSYNPSLLGFRPAWRQRIGCRLRVGRTADSRAADAQSVSTDESRASGSTEPATCWCVTSYAARHAMTPKVSGSGALSRRPVTNADSKEKAPGLTPGLAWK
jgi:hypothetical protein